MDDTIGKDPSETTITAIKTSQTEYSLCEGSDDDDAVTVDSKVDEGSQGRGSFTQTSQQINGELSLCESEKGEDD